MSTASERPPLRFLALGDSYTIGEGVSASERWAQVLVDRLREVGTVIQDPQIIATTGWTTGDLWSAMAEAPPEPPFDLVTLLIGVNDQYQGRSLAEYETQFTDLLDLAVALAGDDASRTVVVSIPDWGVMPYADGRDRDTVASKIDAFNSVAHGVATDRRTHWVNITDLSRQALGRPELAAPDGLHPAAPMHAVWVDRLLPTVREAIG